MCVSESVYDELGGGYGAVEGGAVYDGGFVFHGCEATGDGDALFVAVDGVEGTFLFDRAFSNVSLWNCAVRAQDREVRGKEDRTSKWPDECKAWDRSNLSCSENQFLFLGACTADRERKSYLLSYGPLSSTKGYLVLQIKCYAQQEEDTLLIRNIAIHDTCGRSIFCT